MPPNSHPQRPALSSGVNSSPVMRDVGFMPRPFVSHFPKSVIADFEAADAAAFRDSDRVDLSSPEWLDFLCAPSSERRSSDVRLEGARRALSQSVVSSWSHSLAALKRGNAILVGSLCADSELRSSAVWIGRVTQSESAWLGSPPKRLQMLMQQWQALSQSRLPLSLKMSIATARLLQIHPFSDGNGRTARWYGLLFVMNYLNGSEKTARRLLQFWEQPSSLRHAASYAVCSDSDWTPWFDQWMGTN